MGLTLDIPQCQIDFLAGTSAQLDCTYRKIAEARFAISEPRGIGLDLVAADTWYVTEYLTAIFRVIKSVPLADAGQARDFVQARLGAALDHLHRHRPIRDPFTRIIDVREPVLLRVMSSSLWRQIQDWIDTMASHGDPAQTSPVLSNSAADQIAEDDQYQEERGNVENNFAFSYQCWETAYRPRIAMTLVDGHFVHVDHRNVADLRAALEQIIAIYVTETSLCYSNLLVRQGVDHDDAIAMFGSFAELLAEQTYGKWRHAVERVQVAAGVFAARFDCVFNDASKIARDWLERYVGSNTELAIDMTPPGVSESAGSADGNQTSRASRMQDGPRTTRPSIGPSRRRPRNDRYAEIDKTLVAISESKPESQEAVFKALDSRKIKVPSAEPFETAGGWVAGFKRDPKLARTWLSKRWALLGLPAMPRGPKSAKQRASVGDSV